MSEDKTRRKPPGRKVQSEPEDYGVPRYEQTMVDGNKCYSIANSQVMAEFSKLCAYYWGSSVEGRQRLTEYGAKVYMEKTETLSKKRSEAAKKNTSRVTNNKEIYGPAQKFPSYTQEQYQELMRAAKRPRYDLPTPVTHPTVQTLSQSFQAFDLMPPARIEPQSLADRSDPFWEKAEDSNLDSSSSSEDLPATPGNSPPILPCTDALIFPIYP